MGRLPLALLAVAVLLAGCGGADNSDKDSASQVPATGGLREKVRAAQAVNAADFPAAGGRTLQEVANSAGSAGPELGMASSVFTPGKNRVAFGMIDSKSGFVYGKTALYYAKTPGSPAKGPFVAPADVLAVGDLGVRNAAMRAYDLPAPPKTAELEALAEPWKPHRTRACLYLWRSLENTPD